MKWAAAVAVVLASLLVADVWCDIDYRVWANVSLIAMTILTTLFAGLYGARSKWWSNRIGRIELTVSIVLPMVLAQISVATWWDTGFPGRQHLRFVIYTLGAVVYVPMIVSLWREQQNDRE